MVVSADHRVKETESKKLDQFVNLAWELRNNIKHGDDNANHNFGPLNNPPKPGKKIGGTGDPRKNWDSSDHNTTKID